MNDRELLTLAAKAAGIKLSTDFHVNGETDGGVWWNPLTDDGDALRLSVKTGEPFVVRTTCITTMGGLREDFNPSIEGDDLRAVRRIIVRAAAAASIHQFNPVAAP